MSEQQKDMYRKALGPNVDVFDYGDRGDFERLWEFRGLKQRVLILWTGTPEDVEIEPIKTGPCVSPIEWALCSAKGAGRDLSQWPEVAIIVQNPAVGESAPLYGFCAALREEIRPWLRLFKPTDLLPLAEGATLADRLFPAGAHPGPSEEARRGLEMLTRQVRHQLTEGGAESETDRHAIANIVGPMILRGHAGGKGPSPHAKALRKILDACCLLPVRPEGAPQANGTEGVSHVGQGLHLLLVDDQAERGWADWVRETLPGATLSVHSDPECLIASLERQMGAGAGDRADLRFSFDLPEMSPGLHPVILLDLRLFSDRLADEARFYERVLELWESRKPGQCPWPGFGAGELDEIREWIKAPTKDSPRHHMALTLLPRVLAQMDMSLPIILFSSTGRRGIVDRLAACGNIITSFEKPRFFDLADSESENAVRDNTRRSLLAAIREARTVLAGRHRGREILSVAGGAPAQFDPRRYGHFELCIDESGVGPQMIVGGLVAGFASQKDAQEFDDRLVEAGVRYFPSIAGPGPGAGYLPKTESCREAFERVVAEWRRSEKPLLLSVVALGRICPFQKGLDYLDADFMDNRWRMAVESLVEVFLSEIVGQLGAPGHPPTAAIYAPTRVSPAANERLAREYEGRFGTTVQPMEDPGGSIRWGNNAVAASGLFDVVRALLGHHRLRVELAKAKYVRLAYGDRRYGQRLCPEWFVAHSGAYWLTHAGRGHDESVADSAARVEEEVRLELRARHDNLGHWRAGLRALHYACDCMLRERAVWAGVEQGSPSCYDAYDGSLHGSILASRALDGGRLADAMVEWRRGGGGGLWWCKGAGSASAFIGSRLAEALRHMSGDEFLAACRRCGDLPKAVIPAGPGHPGGAPAKVQGPGAAGDGGEPAEKTSRFRLLIDGMPRRVTREGLMEAASVGGHRPIGVELSDELEGDRRMALLYYGEDVAPVRVAQSLRHRGWRARALIASPVDEARETATVVAAGVEATAEPTTPAEEVPVGIRLLVKGIPEELDLAKVKERVREEFGVTQAVHRFKKARGSTKYNAEFPWPSNLEIPEATSIRCGHELLEIDFESEGP